MEKDTSWYEYKLILSDASGVRNWPKENYEFIRDYVIPLIRTMNIANYQILNYFDQSKKEDFIRFRVEVKSEDDKRVESAIQSLKEKGLIIGFTKEDYDPRSDTEKRIESVRQKLGKMWNKEVSKNWKIRGFRDGKIMVDEADNTSYARKEKAFEVFMGRVLGKWTRIFYEEMSDKPDDIWLFSLYLHLLLNSLAIPGPNEPSVERDIRKLLPY